MPKELTKKERIQAIAALFAQGILRRRKPRNRLEFSAETRLTGDGSKSGPKQTGRQRATPCRR